MSKGRKKITLHAVGIIDKQILAVFFTKTRNFLYKMNKSLELAIS